MSPFRRLWNLVFPPKPNTPPSEDGLVDSVAVAPAPPVEKPHPTPFYHPLILRYLLVCENRCARVQTVLRDFAASLDAQFVELDRVFWADEAGSNFFWAVTARLAAKQLQYSGYLYPHSDIAPLGSETFAPQGYWMLTPLGEYMANELEYGSAFTVDVQKPAESWGKTTDTEAIESVVELPETPVDSVIQETPASFGMNFVGMDLLQGKQVTLQARDLTLYDTDNHPWSVALVVPKPTGVCKILNQDGEKTVLYHTAQALQTVALWLIRYRHECCVPEDLERQVADYFTPNLTEADKIIPGMKPQSRFYNKLTATCGNLKRYDYVTTTDTGLRITDKGFEYMVEHLLSEGAPVTLLPSDAQS